ncbi:DUF6233 domain-containing protein [Streptomyces sp. NPDC060198]|uniref:DUF6233 domain-containing protein n=1 Tax=Streptomyces sp. NPDC060198 TaxID=3347070 RepID=UPI00364EAF08
MSDLPPDVDRLRVIRTHLALQLAEVDRAIAVAERQTFPVQQAAPAPERPPRPRTPAWGIARVGLGSETTVHRGDCWASGAEMTPISQERATAELASGVPPCDICRPDRVLLRPT